MNLKTGIGKPGMAVAAIVAGVMCLMSLLFHPVDTAPLQYGLCLPSPDSWTIPHFWSWAINTVIIGLIALLLYLINKSYNFVRTTEPASEALALVMIASCPWFTGSINISTLLCLCNVICLGIAFGVYDSRNATHQMFTLGVVVGIGSMFQYAFLPMAFVFILWALFLRVLRIKETLAFVTGILCPYWIALGIGWLKISDFHFPSITPLFNMTSDYSDLFVLLAGIAVAAGFGFIVTLINSMKLYAGNSKVNAMNLCVSALGAASVICIIIDYDNILAYVATLFMCCALQCGNICALWNPKMPWVVTVFPSLIYIGIFICAMIF